MLEIFSILLLLVLLSKFIENKTHIPFILIVIILAYSVNYIFDLSILKENFHEIMYLILPIILIPDVLGLSTDELKENSSSILFLAIVAVVISIAIAVLFTYYIDYFPNINFYYLLLLFTPLMATDVVSVGAIFSKFKMPHKLKLYAEGESLFNDITAMVIFFFVAVPLSQGDNITVSSLATVTFKTVIFSVLIGLVFGIIGYFSFKNFHENFSKFISVYLMASLSFLIADKLELSGILAVVIAIIYFKYLFNKEGHYKKVNIANLLHLNSSQNSSSSSYMRAYIKESSYIGFFANAVIFISIATVIEFEQFLKYKYEIIYVFVLTTFVRYIVLALFVGYKKHPIRWLNILTMAGMKGGLALIMIVSLSDEFAYREMFVTIVLGVVILSIFIYTFMLIIYLYLQRNNLKIDKASEHNLIVNNIKDLLKKESETGAYNEIMFEEFVENEIKRAINYNQQFLLIGFQIDKDGVNKVHKKLRKSDIFGRMSEKYYAVLLPHTTLEDILPYSNKLKKIVIDEKISIAQYEQGDTQDILYEKVFSGMGHKSKIAIDI